MRFQRKVKEILNKAERMSAGGDPVEGVVEAKARPGSEMSGRGRVARAWFHLGGGRSDLE